MENLRAIKNNKQEIVISVASCRLDNIITELMNTSRKNANEALKEGRVFLNYENEYKNSKIVRESDLLTIRGEGKFEIATIEEKNKKNKIKIRIQKYK